jgi:hypothetical protein
MRTGLLAPLMALASAAALAAQTQPLLQLQGQPYAGGEMSLHLSGDVGKQAFVLYGLNPLDPPLQLPKGAYYLGWLANIVPLGAIPSSGRIDVPFTVPPLHPSLAGIPLVMQGFVPGALSNPATLPLDQPYLLPQDAIVIDHPVPSFKANFGDKVAAGDFNDDGAVDLAVGAWFETVAGVEKAGRVYIMWGPDFMTWTALEPVTPVYLLHFGQGLAVADFDGDGLDDLAVGEGTGGDPPTPGASGHIYVFRSSRVFSTIPWLTITSAGTGQWAYVFGRKIRIADLDGDAIDDVAVSAPDAAVGGFTKAGRIEIFHGPSYASAVLIENPEPKANDFFGTGLSLADVTGDGVADLLESSGRAKVGAISQAGRCHVYDGPTLTLLQTIDNPEPATNDRFGEQLLATDLDNDGTAEAITSDVKNNFFVVWNPVSGGPVSSWPKPPSPNPIPGAASFGYFFAVMDANADDIEDIVVADPFEGDTVGCFAGGGAFYVALAPYYSTYLRLANPFSACGDSFSWDLIAADLDRDGTDEVLAGDPTADSGGIFNGGRVVILRP